MYKILLISTNQINQFRNEINRTEMDAVVPPFENGLGQSIPFSTQPLPPNVTSASSNQHPIDQSSSVVANEPLTDNNFEDIFESSTTDCTDIYSELPPLNERKIGESTRMSIRNHFIKIIQLSSANYRREEIAKLFKAKESFLVSRINTVGKFYETP